MKQTQCQCACHLSSGTHKPTCTVDGGFSENGLTYCGPGCDAERPEPCVLQHRKPARAVIGQLCDDHYSALREELQNILEMFALAPLYLLPGSVQSDGSKHTKAAEAPAPVRLDILAMTDKRNPATLAWNYKSNYDASKDMLVSNGGDIPDVPGVLEDFAGWVTDERGLQPLRRGWTIADSVRLLQKHLAWIAANDMIDDFTDTIRSLRRFLAQIIGETTPKPVGRCPRQDGDGNECGGPLWPRVDEMAVDCGRCGWYIDEPFLRHLGGMMETA